MSGSPYEACGGKCDFPAPKKIDIFILYLKFLNTGLKSFEVVMCF